MIGVPRLAALLVSGVADEHDLQRRFAGHTPRAEAEQHAVQPGLRSAGGFDEPIGELLDRQAGSIGMIVPDDAIVGGVA